MKTATLLSVSALVLAGVALVTTLIQRPDAGSGATSQEIAVAPQTLDALQQEVARLHQENRDLRDRVAALEVRPQGSPRQPATAQVSMGEFEELRSLVLGELGKGSEDRGATESEAEQLKDRVARSLSEIRQAEAVERVRQKQDKRREELDATMPKITSWLELTASQSTQMRSAMLAQLDRESELTRRWEAGEDPEVLGELKRADREAHVAELSDFLNATQLETYTARGRSK